jgi:hypothetical protein
VIRVSAREITVDRPYHVVKAKVHDMTINLVWERRQEYVSRALERQVDDASEYVNKTLRRPSESAPSATTAAAATLLKPLSAPAPLAQAEILLESVANLDLGLDDGSLPVDLPPEDVAEGAVDLPVDLPPVNNPATQGTRSSLSLKPLKPE